MSDKVIHITHDNFNDIMSRDGLIMVDFYANWCGPCKMLAPVIDKLAEEYEGKVTVAKCNIDENEDIASSFKVVSIPTIYFVKGGHAIDKIVGLVAPNAIKAILDENI